jgi:PEGA domain
VLDQSNGPDPDRPDGTDLRNDVDRLTTEVASLKLELATLLSAHRDSQRQQRPSGVRIPVAMVVKKVEPPVRPSITPAAVVVMLAVGLLSWQLIGTPRNDRISAQSGRLASAAPGAPNAPPRIELPPASPATTEPPVTPLVTPTIYTGTLSVRSDAPGATVFVNRRNVGTAPVRVSNLRAGAHLVWVESEGFRRWTRVVTVPAERVTRITAALEPERAVDQ